MSVMPQGAKLSAVSLVVSSVKGVGRDQFDASNFMTNKNLSGEVFQIGFLKKVVMMVPGQVSSDTIPGTAGPAGRQVVLSAPPCQVCMPGKRLTAGPLSSRCDGCSLVSP